MEKTELEKLLNEKGIIFEENNPFENEEPDEVKMYSLDELVGDLNEKKHD